MSALVAPEVARFVLAVRAELADLDGEVVEELTGGLEADLTDSLEGLAPATGLGDPAAYAAELRSAAGLPPRVAADRPSPGRSPAELLAAWQAGITSHPRWPAVRDFVLVLRPVWWVGRAGVLFWLATVVLVHPARARLLPGSLVGLVLLLLVVLASVQLGRRSAAGSAGRWRWLLLVANVLAVLALPLLLARVPAAGEAVPQPVYSAPVPGQSGLWSGDSEVTDVLPYDSAGRPLTGVQLFDQDGNPLEVQPNSQNNTVLSGDGQSEGVPFVDADGRARWNVFPLQQRPVNPAVPVTPPSPSVEPLATSGPVPSGSATSGPVPSRSTAGSPTASPGASPSGAP